MRVALANLRFPSSPAESVAAAQDAVATAGRGGAQIVCFPECFVPGYRTQGKPFSPVDSVFLEQAWRTIARSAAEYQIGVVLGTERVVDGKLLATALVIDRNGCHLGFQDKTQLDPSEESIYAPGSQRHIFRMGNLTFGIVICHEGWRYPETARWAARRGAQIVFHPQFHEREPGGYAPLRFSDPNNTFHEKALLCRAAENSCFIVSVNCASAGSPTTSTVVRPDGSALCFQPYGLEGLLFADLNLEEATLLLADRYRPLT